MQDESRQVFLLHITVNHYNQAVKEFQKIDKDIYRITGESNNPKIKEVSYPTIDDKN